MRVAVVCCILLLFTATVVYAVEPCLDVSCQVIYGGAECGDCLVQCYPCGPQQCKPACPPARCLPVRPEPCTPVCIPRCDPCLKGGTEIPLAPVPFREIDSECCPRDVYRLLPCLDVCTEFTLCCGGDDFRLLCKLECSPEPKCQQHTCTPAPADDCSCD